MYGEVPVCPGCKDTVVRKLELGQRPGRGYWVDGDFVVVEKGQELGARCVKCGGEGARCYRTKLRWTPRWVWMVVAGVFVSANLFGGLVPDDWTWIAGPLFSLLWLSVLVTALVMRRNGSVGLWLCEVHRKKRVRLQCAVWGTFALGVVLSVLTFFVAVWTGSQVYAFWVLGAGILAMVGSAVGSNFLPIAKAGRIDAEGTIWLKRCGGGYRRSLPKWYPIS